MGMSTFLQEKKKVQSQVMGSEKLKSKRAKRANRTQHVPRAPAAE